MSTKKPTLKTVDTWTMSPEEIFIKHGLTPKRIIKTGACIMPAPKHLQSAKQQQDTKEQGLEDKERKETTASKKDEQKKTEVILEQKAKKKRIRIIELDEDID